MTAALVTTGALVALLAAAPAMDRRAHRDVTACCALLWAAAALLSALYH